ncbi:GIY-YIG nuclease family protein [Bradyrhizobium sp. STM 3843]|uniref:GIY-YIG nuclease family protein n=1 Tax=Bradyrhizobium sp. STM 3843 TaxID=551947 RepID=UPI001586F0AF|nr:GIY-YIG nuclease family protein [Bradyrhizobium sp. STM 3843]
MKIVQKWGFGMAPPKAPTQNERLKSVRTVLAILNGEIVQDLERALAEVSIVKGLFNRVAREDQWDWFYVKGQLGYVPAAAAKQIGFALANLRLALKNNDELALRDIREGTKRLQLLKYLRIFLGELAPTHGPGAGWLYILSTREMSSYLKIGMTTRSVEERVREINAATGVLVPFGIWRCWRVTDPQRAEKLVHSALDEFRVRGDREFFAVEISDAAKTISSVLNESRLLVKSGSSEDEGSSVPGCT